jgi:hypothetical protein
MEAAAGHEHNAINDSVADQWADQARTRFTSWLVTSRGRKPSLA